MAHSILGKERDGQKRQALLGLKARHPVCVVFHLFTVFCFIDCLCLFAGLRKNYNCLNWIQWNCVEGGGMTQWRTHTIMVWIEIRGRFREKMFLSLTLRDVFFKWKTDVFEFVQFGADPNKNLDPVNLNVVSSGVCWALARPPTFVSAFYFTSKKYFSFGLFTQKLKYC